MYDDEYVYADEFFPSHEDKFSNNDYVIPGYAEEEGVSVIVPNFDVLAPVEIAYCNRPAIAPVVIWFPGAVPYRLERAIPYKYNATILEDSVKVLI